MAVSKEYKPLRERCIKLYGLLVLLGYDITAFTPVAYQRGRLPRSFKEISSCGGFRAYMLSALIPSQRSYSAVLLVKIKIIVHMEISLAPSLLAKLSKRSLPLSNQ